MRYALFAVAVAALPAPLRAQAWEVGGGLAWHYFTGYEATALAPELFVHRTLASRLAATVSVRRMNAQETDVEKLLVWSEWYQRRHTVADVGGRLQLIRDGRQELYVSTGASLRHRDDFDLRSIATPGTLREDPTLGERALATCAALPNCVSRRDEVPQGTPLQAGTYLSFAQTRKGITVGGFLEAEYGMRFGRVVMSVHAGARRYAPADTFQAQRLPNPTAWQGGLRASYRF